jgi:hypothetical protein
MTCTNNVNSSPSHLDNTRPLFFQRVVRLTSRICGVLLTVLFCSPAVIPASAQGVPLKGTLVGIETDQFVPTNTVDVHGTGSGNATHLGRFAVEYNITVNLATASGPARAQFIAANGDSLLVEGHGQASETNIPGIVTIVENYIIVGGTGRFAGASGAITVERVVNLTTGITYGTLNGNLVNH